MANNQASEVDNDDDDFDGIDIAGLDNVDLAALSGDNTTGVDGDDPDDEDEEDEDIDSLTEAEAKRLLASKNRRIAQQAKGVDKIKSQMAKVEQGNNQWTGLLNQLENGSAAPNAVATIINYAAKANGLEPEEVVAKALGKPLTKGGMSIDSTEVESMLNDILEELEYETDKVLVSKAVKKVLKGLESKEQQAVAQPKAKEDAETKRLAQEVEKLRQDSERRSKLEKLQRDARSAAPVIEKQLGREYAGFKVTPKMVIEAVLEHPRTQPVQAVKKHFAEQLAEHKYSSGEGRGGGRAERREMVPRGRAGGVPKTTTSPTGPKTFAEMQAFLENSA